MLRIAQRVIVMRDRRKIGEVSPHEADLAGLVDYIANKAEETAA